MVNRKWPPHGATKQLGYSQPIGNCSTQMYHKHPSYFARRPRRCFMRQFRFIHRLSLCVRRVLRAKGRMQMSLPKVVVEAAPAREIQPSWTKLVKIANWLTRPNLGFRTPTQQLGSLSRCSDAVEATASRSQQPGELRGRVKLSRYQQVMRPPAHLAFISFYHSR